MAPPDDAKSAADDLIASIRDAQDLVARIRTVVPTLDVGKPPHAPPTPGLKTTEFWLALAALVIGAVIFTHGATPEERAQGTTLMTWATAGYVGSRTIAKAADVLRKK